MLSRRIRWLRTGLVFITGGLFLSVLIAVSVFLAPKVYEQATGFVRGFFVYMERVDVELISLAERYPMLQEAIPELRKPTPPAPVSYTHLDVYKRQTPPRPHRNRIVFSPLNKVCND